MLNLQTHFYDLHRLNDGVQGSPPVLDSVEHLLPRKNSLHRFPVEYIVEVFGHKIDFAVNSRKTSCKTERRVFVFLFNLVYFV